MRGLVKRIFEQLNIPANYLETGGGKEAFEILEKNKIDLVLLDWNIPELSGIDFLRKARGMDKYRNTPIVMVSSETSKINIVEAVKAGATAYITKPFTEKSFLEKITKITF